MAANKIFKLARKIFRRDTMEPREAYNLWAANYDHQSGNLMLDLDSGVFSDLLSTIDVEGKDIADIGCGTGRHWEKLFSLQPKQLTGYDVSEEMLNQLRQKFPRAETRQVDSEKLPQTGPGSFDLICSTLTVAHIKNLETALREWDRALKQGGDLIITDYHPVILQKGGKRTFSYNNETIAVTNYTYPVATIREIAGQLKFDEIRYIEKIIDGSVRHYYEERNAMEVYKKFEGDPVIYGIHFKK